MGDRILIIDDEVSMCDLLETQLKKRGFEIESHTSAEKALEALAQREFDAVVTDLNMPGMDGIDLTERITSNRPDVPVIIITSFGTMDTAVASLRAGAYDFITKPFEIEVLVLALNHSIQHRRLREEVQLLTNVLDDTGGFEDLLGQSTRMKKVFSLVEKAAASGVTVLITGESGTGKELIARALHQRGRRCTGPFVAINCAAMPEMLLETELFGHVKGAFTDAKTARTGLFVKADSGTLFLDEIGEMPVGLQPKLLRALEERKVRPVGGNSEMSFDAHIIAASNRDLGLAVEERRFREDLYYRLNVVQIEMPPLRERGRDILILAQHFLDQFAEQMGRPIKGFTTAAAETLLGYSWPGNVRELKNSMEHAVALTSCDKITVEDLPEKIRKYKTYHVLVSSQNPSELVTMEEVERRYILQVLQAVNGNKTLAARTLGFDRKTLYRKLERYKVSS